ncbi:MAG: hypothetical protein AAGD96_28585, partial [Chloroflexota bacterium]
EQPIHIDEFRRRLARSLDSKSVTTLVKNTSNQLLAWGTVKNKIVKTGDFIRQFGQDLDATPRDRSNLERVSRKLDYVLDLEIKIAIENLKAAGIELTEKNAVLVVSKYLGVIRPKGKQASRILAHL